MLLVLLGGGSRARAENLDLDPDWMKAMIRVETGYNAAAYESDPMQVNKLGDWRGYKGRIGLEPGVPPGEDAGVTAGLALLDIEAWRFDASGKPVVFLGWKEAARRYNGGGDPHYLEKVETAYQDIKHGR